jgi:hypothetical protein
LLARNPSEELQMIWEVPAFVEIEMNAEIGSYQEDFDGQDYQGL